MTDCKIYYCREEGEVQEDEMKITLAGPFYDSDINIRNMAAEEFCEWESRQDHELDEKILEKGGVIIVRDEVGVETKHAICADISLTYFASLKKAMENEQKFYCREEGSGYGAAKKIIFEPIMGTELITRGAAAASYCREHAFWENKKTIIVEDESGKGTRHEVTIKCTYLVDKEAMEE